VSARVAVLIFPGTNSEEETVRACRAVGLAADLVHWNADLDDVRQYDAYVLPGGFAYEDRVRAGAIAAHDRLMAAVREGAASGKLVLGICNGAQVLLEAGLAPALGGDTSIQAGFAKNAPLGKFRSTHVYVKLAIQPERSRITAHLSPNAVIPAWASHGEGRLAAPNDVLERIAREGHLAFVYCDARGCTNSARLFDSSAAPGTHTPERIGNLKSSATDAWDDIVPNGSALGAAGIVNAAGNVLALMPHPERDAWTFNHHDESRERARGNASAMLAPSGGIALFESFAKALT
jgi:phosphoribosylformylglycinamidine (FGAM) synthase-like amidotransferase family enzyme